jgi:hypothetical protein
MSKIKKTLKTVFAVINFLPNILRVELKIAQFNMKPSLRKNPKKIYDLNFFPKNQFLWPSHVEHEVVDTDFINIFPSEKLQ